MQAFHKLFSPGAIGKTEIKNRIIMSPMGTLSHRPDSSLKDEVTDYYAQRAKGGVGLVICQSCTILPEAAAPHRPGIWHDKFIPGFRKAAQTIHQWDAKCAVQLNHHGRLLTQYQHVKPQGKTIKPIAPSAVPRLFTKLGLSGRSRGSTRGSVWERSNVQPLEATHEDIAHIKSAFAEAARRAMEAGFDAIEVHGAHGYLISQFLSPLINIRNDEYGGTFSNRARFACEVIEAIKNKVGTNLSIILRISGSDYMEGGININEVCQQAPLFVDAGVDALDISASEQASVDWQHPSFMFPSGPLVPLAEQVKKVVNIPIITVGKIDDPHLADRIVSQRKADFVALGRPLLADPELPNKARKGKAKDIRKCIYCLNCLNFEEHPHILSQGVACTVNPALLREESFRLNPVSKPKEVYVIGAGLAGMEAARALSARGHRVTLFEKTDMLGGQWRVACKQKQKERDYPNLLNQMVEDIKESNVKVVYNVEFTPQCLNHKSPDALVVATGAKPIRLNVQGVDSSNVVFAEDVILGKATVGSKVTVIGGRYKGLELCDYLVDLGKEVRLVTRSSIGRGMERSLLTTLRNNLIEKKVQMFSYAPVVQIRPNGIYIAYEDNLVFLKSDTVILAVGMESENNLITELQGIIPEIHAIGDCVEPRDAMWAIREAAEIARLI